MIDLLYLDGVYLGIVCVLCVGMSSRTKRTRTGGRAHQPSPVPVFDQVRFVDEKQSADYTIQLGRSHHATRWYCEETGRALNMHNDIVEAFGYLGATSLITMRHNSYEALTSEFLSSLETNVENPRLGGTIKFRLGNVSRVVTLAEWNAIFGFWNFRREFRAQQDYPVRGFWARITGQANVPGGANIFEKDIASPLFRVIHRILGNTLWAKKENSRVTYRELAALYHVLYDLKENRMNWGFELLLHLKNYKGKLGDVWIGGMITQVAVHFGIDLSAYSFKASKLIDRAHLLTYKVIELKDGVLLSKWKDRRTILSAPKMDLLWVPNWYDTWAQEVFPRDVDRQDNRNNHARRSRPRREYEEEVPGPREGEDDEAYARRLEREVNIEMGDEEEDEEEEHVNMDATGTSYGEQATFGGEQTFVGGASGSQPYYGGDNPGSYDHLCNEMRGMRTDFGDFRESFRREYREDLRVHREEMSTAIGTVASSISGLREDIERRWASEDERRVAEDRRWGLHEAEMRAQFEHRELVHGFFSTFPGYPPPPPPDF